MKLKYEMGAKSANFLQIPTSPKVFWGREVPFGEQYVELMFCSSRETLKIKLENHF